MKTLSLLLLLISCSVNASIKLEKTFLKKNYRSSKDRKYLLYLPEEKPKNRPLLVLLHGCKQTSDDILKLSRFAAFVDKYKFNLLVPFVTTYEGKRIKNCWGFWSDVETQKGQGENQDLVELSKEVIADYKVDKNKVFVAGLSSGAGMATILGVQHHDVFKGIAPVAGPGYKDLATSVTMSCLQMPVSKSKSTLVKSISSQFSNNETLKVLVAHSLNDCVVQSFVARKSVYAWQSILGLKSLSTQKKRVNGIDTETVIYESDTQKRLLKTIWVEDVGHGWFGGGEGPYGDTRGPNLSLEILKSFEITQ